MHRSQEDENVHKKNVAFGVYTIITALVVVFLVYMMLYQKEMLGDKIWGSFTFKHAVMGLIVLLSGVFVLATFLIK